jgi:single-strand DNA-binding protein
MNEIQVTIRGNVTSDPRQIQFDDGNILTSFRLASNSRRYDAQSREWLSTGTTFVNVNCRRGLATNVARSLVKGQPVIVTGKLRERAWESNGRSGRSLEVEADGLGHDLAWGTSHFARVVRAEQVRNVEDEQAAQMARELAAQEEEERRLENGLGGSQPDHPFGHDGIEVDPATGEIVSGYQHPMTLDDKDHHGDHDGDGDSGQDGGNDAGDLRAGDLAATGVSR